MIDHPATSATAAATAAGENNEASSLFVLPCIVSCAMALSTLEIAIEVEKNDNDDDDGYRSNHLGSTTNNNDDNEKQSSSKRKKGLDRGDNCAMALLSCVQAYCCCQRCPC